MNRPPRPLRLLVSCCTLVVLVPPVAADRHVAVVSSANPEYTQRKFAEGQSQPESYVFMQGRYFEGVRADRSIDKLSFREIAGFLAPELARAQYFPTKDVRNADLLLIVHWGTTRPWATSTDITARDVVSTDQGSRSVIGDSGAEVAFLTSYDPTVEQVQRENLDQLSARMGDEFTAANNAILLGYTRNLREFSRSALQSTQEEAMRLDLSSERYFIIVKAYDLRVKPPPGRTRRAVWSLYANVSSPGNNFTGALNLMGGAAANFFGRSTDGMVTIRPDEREGKVNLAPLIILGEAK